MFVIHAGMHKTGSTSIQRYFAQTDVKGIHYLKWRKANHSDLSELLFGEKPETYGEFKREGRTAEEMRKWREKAMARLRVDLSKHDGQTHIFSAEQLSNATPDMIARMIDMFEPYASPFKVIIYVRAPREYMTSRAQQRIRTGAMYLPLIWPNYRKSIEPLDDAFGKQVVDVRIYNPQNESNWNVINDFCAAADISHSATSEKRANRALGACQLALLLDRRTNNGGAPTTAQERQAEAKFLDEIEKLPSSPFTIASHCLQSIVEENNDDLAWIKQRLGGIDLDAPLTSKPDAVVFGSTKDILDYASKCKSTTEAKRNLSATKTSLIARFKRAILG